MIVWYVLAVVVGILAALTVRYLHLRYLRRLEELFDRMHDEGEWP